VRSWRREPDFRSTVEPITGPSTMQIPREATLLSVFLNATDRWQGKPIYKAIVEIARTMHLAGASVFRVDFSYGTHRQIHDAKSDYLSFDIPVVVEIVDSEENVERMMTELETMIVEGLVVRRSVQVRRYAGRSHLQAAGSSVPEEDPRHATALHGSPSTMRIEGEAQRVTVYIGNSDTWHGRNLATAIVEKCRELGIAGATATVGVMGFGKTSRIHRAHLLGLSEDLPERIEIVDSPDQIARILPALDEFVQGGLVVLEDVHIFRYQHDPKPSRR
jgi:PII-like signaling protein